MAGTNKMIGTFANKPRTQALYQAVDMTIRALGPVDTEVKSQRSYKRQRKFLWLWTYEQTADGTLFLAFLLDHQLEAPCIHAVQQISAHRWHHNVVLKSLAQAHQPDLIDALTRAYQFAGN